MSPNWNFAASKFAFSGIACCDVCLILLPLEEDVGIVALSAQEVVRGLLAWQHREVVKWILHNVTSVVIKDPVVIVL